jgi:hypothetical protein
MKDEMGGACSTDRGEERWYGVLVGKSEEMRPHGKPMRTVKDNIKIGLMQTGWEDVDWSNLALERNKWRALVNAALNLGFQKIPVISSVVEKVLGSEKRHCSVELVGQSVQYKTVQ